MDIQFRKGTEEYLDSCIKAMEHSSICTAYFLIGKKLLEFIENILFKRRDIFLLVGDYNPDAKIFYEKLGYKYLATIPSLYRIGMTNF